MRGIVIILIILLANIKFGIAQSDIKYEVINIDINNKNDNLGAFFYGSNYIIYSSPKKKKNANLDFYIGLSDETGVVVETKRLGKTINSEFNELDLVYTHDQKKVYFTNNAFDANSKEYFEIFSADVAPNNQWYNITKLALNTSKTSNAYPFLSKDNKVLYFSSKRKESIGGFDIFKVKILGNNKFSKAVNLGKRINTPKDEITPYILNNILYYSSNGLKGMGGFDIFVTRLDTVSEVSNLGAPINSAKNDFYFKRKPYRDFGFFTSNRDGGKGNNDIYYFKALESEEAITNRLKIEKPIITPKKELAKNVYDFQRRIAYNEREKDSIAKVKKEMTIIKKDPVITKEVSKPVVKKQKTIKVIKVNSEIADNVYDFQRRIAYNNTYEEKTIDDNKLNALSKKDRCVYLVEHLSDIYFDLNKFNIRPDAATELNKAIKVMKKCTNFKFVASSHTDSQGPAKYNTALSQRRANSVVSYLIKGGIVPTRISGVGYGESRLKNYCADGIKCSKAEHQLNRRTELEIISN